MHLATHLTYVLAQLRRAPDLLVHLSDDADEVWEPFLRDDTDDAGAAGFAPALVPTPSGALAGVG